MTDYKFTKDWFSWAPPVWEQLIPALPSNNRSFLEIGSFEGRSTVWIIENMMGPGDWIDCVDTWEGGEEHGAEDMDGAEQRFVHNITVALGGVNIKEPTEFSSSKHTRFASFGGDAENNRVYKYKTSSTDMLAQKLHFQISCVKPEYVPMYDFIYIDGSHVAKDVLTDACMAWPLLKPAGFMVFDDYLWGPPRDVLHRPKVAIDAFCNLFAEEVEIVHVGYQLVVRKK